jgi:hypothetical protein
MIDWNSFLNQEGAPEGPLPVVGFRAFHVSATGKQLTSYAHQYEWEAGKNTSEPCSQCVSTFELVEETRSITEPDGTKWTETVRRHIEGVWPAFRDCRCGFWAAHTLEELMEQSYGHKDRNCLIGGVVGWGRVQVGTKLWRAQYAKIIALTDGIPIKAVVHKGRTLRWLHERHPEGKIDRASQEYGVPIVPLHKLVEFMREHGEQAYNPDKPTRGR